MKIILLSNINKEKYIRRIKVKIINRFKRNIKYIININEDNIIK